MNSPEEIKSFEKSIKKKFRDKTVVSKTVKPLFKSNESNEISTNVKNKSKAPNLKRSFAIGVLVFILVLTAIAWRFYYGVVIPQREQVYLDNLNIAIENVSKFEKGLDTEIKTVTSTNVINDDYETVLTVVNSQNINRLDEIEESRIFASQQRPPSVNEDFEDAQEYFDEFEDLVEEFQLVVDAMKRIAPVSGEIEESQVRIEEILADDNYYNFSEDLIGISSEYIEHAQLIETSANSSVQGYFNILSQSLRYNADYYQEMGDFYKKIELALKERNEGALEELSGELKALQVEYNDQSVKFNDQSVVEIDKIRASLLEKSSQLGAN